MPVNLEDFAFERKSYLTDISTATRISHVSNWAINSNSLDKCPRREL